jgi:hypothetical protein
MGEIRLGLLLGTLAFGVTALADQPRITVPTWRDLHRMGFGTGEPASLTEPSWLFEPVVEVDLNRRGDQRRKQAERDFFKVSTDSEVYGWNIFNFQGANQFGSLERLAASFLNSNARSDEDDHGSGSRGRGRRRADRSIEPEPEDHETTDAQKRALQLAAYAGIAGPAFARILENEALKIKLPQQLGIEMQVSNLRKKYMARYLLVYNAVVMGRIDGKQIPVLDDDGNPVTRRDGQAVTRLVADEDASSISNGELYSLLRRRMRSEISNGEPEVLTLRGIKFDYTWGGLAEMHAALGRERSPLTWPENVDLIFQGLPAKSAREAAKEMVLALAHHSVLQVRGETRLETYTERFHRLMVAELGENRLDEVVNQLQVSELEDLARKVIAAFERTDGTFSDQAISDVAVNASSTIGQLGRQPSRSAIARAVGQSLQSNGAIGSDPNGVTRWGNRAVEALVQLFGDRWRRELIHANQANRAFMIRRALTAARSEYSLRFGDGSEKPRRDQFPGLFAEHFLNKNADLFVAEVGRQLQENYYNPRLLVAIRQAMMVRLLSEESARSFRIPVSAIRSDQLVRQYRIRRDALFSVSDQRGAVFVMVVSGESRAAFTRRYIRALNTASLRRSREIIEGFDLNGRDPTEEEIEHLRLELARFRQERSAPIAEELLEGDFAEDIEQEKLSVEFDRVEHRSQDLVETPDMERQPGAGPVDFTRIVRNLAVNRVFQTHYRLREAPIVAQAIPGQDQVGIVVGLDHEVIQERYLLPTSVRQMLESQLEHRRQRAGDSSLDARVREAARNAVSEIETEIAATLSLDEWYRGRDEVLAPLTEEVETLESKRDLRLAYAEKERLESVIPAADRRLAATEATHERRVQELLAQWRGGQITIEVYRQQVALTRNTLEDVRGEVDGLHEELENAEEQITNLETRLGGAIDRNGADPQTGFLPAEQARYDQIQGRTARLLFEKRSVQARVRSLRASIEMTGRLHMMRESVDRLFERNPVIVQRDLCSNSAWPCLTRRGGVGIRIAKRDLVNALMLEAPYPRETFDSYQQLDLPADPNYVIGVDGRGQPLMSTLGRPGLRHRVAEASDAMLRMALVYFPLERVSSERYFERKREVEEARRAAEERRRRAREEREREEAESEAEAS